MVCGSMEGFLQSLKQKDKDKQRQICSMKGKKLTKMRDDYDKRDKHLGRIKIVFEEDGEPYRCTVWGSPDFVDASP